MTRPRLDMGEAPTAAGAPPLTTRRIEHTMDTTSQQLREGAAAFAAIDRTGIPTDVRDLARSAAAYARLVARHLDGPLDAGTTDDLLHLGEIVAQHAAITDATGEGRPAVRLVAAAARWLVFASQLPLVGFPTGESTIATAVDQAIQRARLAGDVPDTTDVMAGVL